MTIEVQITNKSRDRNIEVQDIDLNRETSAVTEGAKRSVGPGESTTVWVHSTRDIKVSEPQA